MTMARTANPAVPPPIAAVIGSVSGLEVVFGKLVECFDGVLEEGVGVVLGVVLAGVVRIVGVVVVGNSTV
jgi:hypothetical protein